LGKPNYRFGKLGKLAVAYSLRQPPSENIHKAMASSLDFHIPHQSSSLSNTIQTHTLTLMATTSTSAAPRSDDFAFIGAWAADKDVLRKEECKH
jgi:hypothetical protein